MSLSKGTGEIYDNEISKRKHFAEVNFKFLFIFSGITGRNIIFSEEKSLMGVVENFKIIIYSTITFRQIHSFVLFNIIIKKIILTKINQNNLLFNN